jgi:hypothetical protein
LLKCVDHQAVYETSAAVMLVLFFLAEAPNWSLIQKWENLELALVQFLLLRALVIKKGLVKSADGEHGHVADIVAPFVTKDQYDHLVGVIAPFASKLKVEPITLQKPFPPTNGCAKLDDLPDELALSAKTPSAVVIRNGDKAPFFDVAFMCRTKARGGEDVLVSLRLQAKFTSVGDTASDGVCEDEAEKLGIDPRGNDTQYAKATLLKKKVCCGATVREEVAGCIVAPMHHSRIAHHDGFEWQFGVSVITEKAKERLYPVSLLFAPAVPKPSKRALSPRK